MPLISKAFALYKILSRDSFGEGQFFLLTRPRHGSRFLRASFAGRRISLQSQTEEHAPSRKNPFHVGHNELANYTLAGDLEKRFPEDTFVKFTYAPVLHALALLAWGKPADSVERLQIALRYELAANGLNVNHYLGGLYSAYVRGEAFVAAHRYAEAAAEFQKILDHRGIVGADPIGALAHLQLGRTFVLAGDKVKA